MSLRSLSDTSASQVEDSLKWTAGKSFLGYGVRFRLRTNNMQGLEQALAYLPLGWEEIASPEADVLYSLYLAPLSQKPILNAEHLLYANAELIARDNTSARVLRKFAEHSRLLTTLYAKDRLFVHAGVVGWYGHAILIPGRSLTGKTTLVKALVEAGAVYYSDEFAVLDREGYTHPYPLSLSIRTPDGTATKASVTTIGGQVGREPLPVKLIVITEYADGTQWQPRTLSPSRAMLALMDNTVAARREPQFSMPILRAAALRATTIQSARGDADSIVPELLRLVAQE
jgi:hypothetical protein